MPYEWSGQVAQIEEAREGWEKILFQVVGRVRREGGVVVLKVDGERVDEDALPATCVISRGRLGDEFVRRDAETLPAAAAWCLRRYFGNQSEAGTLPTTSTKS